MGLTQLIRKQVNIKIKEFNFYYIIDIYSKYTWFIPLKGEEGIMMTNVFQKILDKSNRKPKKVGVDKGSEFQN